MNTDASGQSGGSLSQERWAAIEQLYWAAHELDVAAREALLQSSSAPAEVVDEVRSMLRATDSGGLQVEQRFVQDQPADGAGLPPGTRIGPYELLALAGRGGMGEVYRARRVDGALDLEVAIKLLRPDARSAALQRRFMAERAVLARLNHPNIATILDAGIAPDGRPFLALRYVDGVPISAFAATLPLAARLQLFLKVADAVQFAHTNLIVHRDLKPSNILVTSAGEPILLDFGIAKLLGDEASSEGPTHVGEQLLTPSHAAPEQLLGEAVTTATDVHGLGALLFEMLTGCHPYATVGSRPSDVERAILESPAPPPSTVTRDALTRHTIRGDLDSVVQMALRKEPTRRYATAHEFAADVRRAMDGQPVRARPDHWHYRARRFVQRNRVATVAAAAIVAITIGALAREVVLSRRLTRERDRAVAEQQAGEDVLAFVTDLFEQANPNLVPGADTLRVGPFLTRAELLLRTLDAQPRRQLRVARTLGAMRLSRGDYAVAESLLTRAIAAGVKTLGSEDIDVLRARDVLAGVLVQFRGERAAYAQADTALQAVKRSANATAPDLANAYARLATVSADPARVRVLLDSALARSATDTTVDSIAIAGALDARARERGMSGKRAEAAALEGAAYRIVTARFPAEHDIVMTVRGNLSTWQNGAGQWEPSLEHALAILDVMRRKTTPGHTLALAHERVALVAINIPGRLALADSMDREALRIFRATLAPEHPLIRSAMRNLAIITAQRGRAARGLALLDSAIAMTFASNDSIGARYMIGQRVPMLLALARNAEADSSARMASTTRARQKVGSDSAALMDWHSGLAALANGRAQEADSLFAQIVSIGGGDGGNSLDQWRWISARCALGVARSRAGKSGEARVHLGEACPALSRWGRADRTLVRWAGAGRE